EVRHVHLGDIVELEKAEMCWWPLKSQPTSRMTFTACSLTSLLGFMPALQTCVSRLADIFNSAFAIGLRLAFLMQTNRTFNGSPLPSARRAPRIRPVVLRAPARSAYTWVNSAPNGRICDE